jgi:hypothetical protein
VLPCGGALATEEGAEACITLQRLTGQCDYRAWRVSRRGVALFARRGSGDAEKKGALVVLCRN